MWGLTKYIELDVDRNGGGNDVGNGGEGSDGITTIRGSPVFAKKGPMRFRTLVEIAGGRF
jgi:hypothetical protein